MRAASLLSLNVLRFDSDIHPCGRAIAVGFASYAVRMTYNGSYKHTKALNGAALAITRNGGLFTCDGAVK